MSIIYCESVQILSNPSVHNDDMLFFFFVICTVDILFLNEHGRIKYLYIFLSCLLTVTFSFNTLRSILRCRTLEHDFKP